MAVVPGSACTAVSYISALLMKSQIQCDLAHFISRATLKVQRVMNLIGPVTSILRNFPVSTKKDFSEIVHRVLDENLMLPVETGRYRTQVIRNNAHT